MYDFLITGSECTIDKIMNIKESEPQELLPFLKSEQFISKTVD